ncbi:MAG: glycosyl hydrolase family 18 protein [Candidatus Nanopelagicales bacterium]
MFRQLGGARRGSLRAIGVVALALVMVAAGPGGAPAPAAAADPSGGSLVTGWLPGWATSTALPAVEGNSDLMSEVSPFWFTAKASSSSVSVTSSVSASTSARVVASLRARRIAIVPSVADGSAARAMAGILTSSRARAAHVAQLVALVVDNHYDGIELDYEQFAFADGSSTWATTRPAWVAFVTDLGRALHAQDKRLALAVPVIYNGARTSASGYWVYDYAGVAGSVDSLRIMTYDYSVSRPGPIAPLSFLRRTLDYAVTAFPAAKIRMGVPAYGRLWTARKSNGALSISGTCPSGAPPSTRSFTTATALSYLTSIAGRTPNLRFDQSTGEMVATFAKEYSGKDSAGRTTSCVVDHEAWWVDARGVAARLPLVAQYGLAGVALWHLGGVDRASWDAMRTFAQGTAFGPSAPSSPTPTPSPSPTSSPSPTPSPTTSKPSSTVVRVTPSTTKPRPGTTVKFRVEVTPKKAKVTVKRQMLVRGSWSTMATGQTGSTGRVTFSVRWPKDLVARTYRVITTKKGAMPGGRSGTFRLIPDPPVKALTATAATVAVTPSTKTPKAGSRITFAVRVSPARKGVTVARQMRVAGAWKTMAEKRTNSAGQVTFAFQWLSGDGTRTYRVLAKKSGSLQAGHSATFALRTR